jgi:hypothetical protein
MMFKGASSNANYSTRQLLKAIGRVDGLVARDEEVRKLMLDWEALWSRIKMTVVAKNKDSTSTEEDRKIMHIKTRSAIVVI